MASLEVLRIVMDLHVLELEQLRLRYPEATDDVVSCLSRAKQIRDWLCEDGRYCEDERDGDRVH